MFEFAREIRPAVTLFLAFTLLTGLAYPLFITGIVQTAMPAKAEGSLIVVDGRIVGSELIGQTFKSPGYFHGRPSACQLQRQRLRCQQPRANQCQAHGRGEPKDRSSPARE